MDNIYSTARNFRAEDLTARIDQVDCAFLFRNARLSRRFPPLLPSFRKWRTDKRVGLSPRPTDYVLFWCLGPEILPCPVTLSNQDPPGAMRNFFFVILMILS